jgi:hypothetical protein
VLDTTVVTGRGALTVADNQTNAEWLGKHQEYGGEPPLKRGGSR